MAKNDLRGMKRGENWFLEIWKNFSLEIFFGDMKNFEKKSEKILLAQYDPRGMKRGENWFLKNLKIFSLEIFFGDMEILRKNQKKFYRPFTSVPCKK